MRIVVAGSSGFLGGHLLRALRTDGHEITRLVRRAPRSPDEVSWNPDGGELDPAVVSDADAIINLAGVNVADKRWTGAFKAKLVSSRVEPTGTIARTLAALPEAHRPQVLVNASAVGWYGDTGDQPVVENDPAGDGFLADLCRVWEAATGPAEEAGVRVVRLRTGFPLAADGGALKPMLIQFRLFAGGRMGSGRQYMPWISIADWVSAVQFLLRRTDIAGSVNLCGPRPAHNAEFAAALGRVLHRPAIWPIPAPVLRAALGELGTESVKSQYALPGVLNEAGYQFQHGDVETALRAALE